MKTEKFKRANGTEGEKHMLEVGDIFTPKFNIAKETKFGDYMNYSLSASCNGQDLFLNLTKGQAEALKKIHETNGDLINKNLTAIEYENEYGKFVGIRLLKEE